MLFFFRSLGPSATVGALKLPERNLCSVPPGQDPSNPASGVAVLGLAARVLHAILQLDETAPLRTVTDVSVDE